MQPKKPHAVAASSGAAARATAHTTERVHIMDEATSPPTGVDTLSVSEDLQQAGFTQPQANSLAHWLGKLVTKEDLRRVATHLNDKIEKFNKDLNDKIERFNKDLHKKIDGVSRELHKKIDGVSREMRDKFEKMNGKFDKMNDKFDKMNDKIDDSNKELRNNINDVRKELSAKIDKNVYILLGGITALLGIMTVVQKLWP